LRPGRRRLDSSRGEGYAADRADTEEALRSGRADLCPVLAVNEARSRFLIFTETTETFGIEIVVRARLRAGTAWP